MADARNTNPVELRDSLVEAVHRGLEDRYSSRQPLNTEDALTHVQWVTRSPEFTRKWTERIAQRQREGVFIGERFQAALRSVLREQFRQSMRPPGLSIDELRIIDAKLHPGAGRRRYMDIHESLLRSHVVEGQSAVYLGPPGSGKSYLLAYHMGELAQLRAGHEEALARGDGRSSTLALLWRYSWRYGAGEEWGSVAETAEEEGGKAPKILTAVNAAGIRFVSNMDVLPKSPAYAAHTKVGSIAELLRESIRNSAADDPRKRHLTFGADDEHGTSENARRSQSDRNVDFQELRAQQRKFGLVFAHVAQWSTQLDRTLKESALSVFEKPKDKHSDVIATVSGVCDHERIAGIPPVAIDWFESGRTTMMDANLRLSSFVPILDMDEHEFQVREGRSWSRSEWSENALRRLRLVTTSAQQMANGQDGHVRSEVLSLMVRGVPDARIVADLSATYGRQDDYYTDFVAECRKAYESRLKDERKVRKGERKPPTADELADDYLALMDHPDGMLTRAE